MKKKRIAAATISVLTLISAITGSYAYFTDKKSIDISAKTTNLAIEVDDREFTNEKVKNMLPGDSRELSYTVTNVGKADALVIFVQPENIS